MEEDENYYIIYLLTQFFERELEHQYSSEDCYELATILTEEFDIKEKQ